MPLDCSTLGETCMKTNSPTHALAGRASFLGPVLIAHSLACMPLLASEPAAPARETFHLDEQGEKQWGYAQAVRIGNTIYLSGTTGRGETLEQQLQSAYDRISRTLAHYGAAPRQIVKETIFTTDMEALQAAQPSRRKFYGDHAPASSWIGIDRLFVPRLKIEIEVIVVLD
jgi:2-iminobutanoate/2-iminopropanoate deaminase